MLIIGKLQMKMSINIVSPIFHKKSNAFFVKDRRERKKEEREKFKKNVKKMPCFIDILRENMLYFNN
jgi:hypothetical protein